MLACSLAHLLTCSHLLSLAHLLACSLAHLLTCPLARHPTNQQPHASECGLGKRANKRTNERTSERANERARASGGLEGGTAGERDKRQQPKTRTHTDRARQRSGGDGWMDGWNWTGRFENSKEAPRMVRNTGWTRSRFADAGKRSDGAESTHAVMGDTDAVEERAG